MHCSTALLRLILKATACANALARVACNPPPGHVSATSLIRRCLHWLPIKQRMKYKIAKLTHSIRQIARPAYLSHMVQPYIPARNLRSFDAHLITAPRTKLTMTSRSFQHAAPAVWNDLPLFLRATSSTATFHKLLKTHLMSSTSPH